MRPPAPSSAVAPKQLPPLPDLSASAPGGSPSPGGPASPMAGLLSAIAPIKAAVDQIHQACAQIVQSGAIPGAEQICAQLVALSQSLLPMAAQNLMQPMGGGGAGAPGGGIPMPAP